MSSTPRAKHLQTRQQSIHQTIPFLTRQRSPTQVFWMQLMEKNQARISMPHMPVLSKVLLIYCIPQSQTVLPGEDGSDDSDFDNLAQELFIGFEQGDPGLM